ncbi:30361_t:CDS:1, partial [Gigaspora margarita]
TKEDQENQELSKSKLEVIVENPKLNKEVNIAKATLTATDTIMIAIANAFEKDDEKSLLKIEFYYSNRT